MDSSAFEIRTEEENMLVCPFNKNHVVKSTRYGSHLLKCSRKKESRKCHVKNVDLPFNNTRMRPNSENVCSYFPKVSLQGLEKNEEFRNWQQAVNLQYNPPVPVKVLDDSAEGDKLSEVKLLFHEKMVAKEYVTTIEKITTWLSDVELKSNVKEEDDWEENWDGFKDWDIPNSNLFCKVQKKCCAQQPSQFRRSSSRLEPSGVGRDRLLTYGEEKFQEPGLSRQKVQDRNNFLEIEVSQDIMLKPDERGCGPKTYINNSKPVTKSLGRENDISN